VCSDSGGIALDQVQGSKAEGWQRVRGSNPSFSLERALIYFCKHPITSELCVTLLCVAALVAHIILSDLTN
jgi:hypothetical protein